MSHNVLKVADQNPNLQGVIDLATNDLGGFATPNDANYLGVDNSGDPKNSTVSVANPLTPVYGMQVVNTGWGGNSTYSVGSYLAFRRASATEYINSSYCAVGYFGYPGHTTWGDYVQLQPGKYFLIWNTGFAGNSTSDYADVRLKNITSGTHVGPTFKRGQGKNSGSYYVIADVDSASNFAFEIIAKSGTLSLSQAAEQRYFSISILRF